ncbi:MAG: AMP-binding protein [Terriglobia bacterium]
MKHTAPDLSAFASLGEALHAALQKWDSLTALIEADRERENCRLRYSDFHQAALPIVQALQKAGLQAEGRVAIILSNQSKWLIAAYGLFYAGGVLVPLDFKLSAVEHLQLLTHASVQGLIVEYPYWTALRQSPDFSEFRVPFVLVVDAPKGADLAGAHRWEDCVMTEAAPRFVPRTRQDLACIVYSSGTGGRPKGCMLTHENYLEQCQSLMTWYPFWPGVRYLSILPTNHAIDFMVGFLGPFFCGATVVHLRTLRPEFIRDAFRRYQITYASVVPLVLKAFESGLKQKIQQLRPRDQKMLRALMRINRWLTRGRPRPWISRRLFSQIHEAFGGKLQALITGGAFAEPSTLQFFYDLGIPVANGYGLTEAGTAVTVNDLKPFRADTVGKPLPGVEIKILDPDPEGIGQVAVRSKTLMKGYLNDPGMTAEVLVHGWLHTGDLGRMDATGHLQLYGRLKNMIVTEGGKNIYPEDVESAFQGLPVKEFCVYALNYIFKKQNLAGEQLMIVIRLDPGQELTPAVIQDLQSRNQRLPDFKRISGLLLEEEDFPRTASLKIKRVLLAERIASKWKQSDVKSL